MARVECGQAPWPPQHGSSHQHARASQVRHVVVVVSVTTSGTTGRRWRRQTGRRRDATGRRRRRRQQHHAFGRRRAADSRRRHRLQARDESRPPVPLPSPRTAGTGRGCIERIMDFLCAPHIFVFDFEVALCIRNSSTKKVGMRPKSRFWPKSPHFGQKRPKSQGKASDRSQKQAILCC